VRPLVVLLLATALVGCADEQILHGLDERQANEVLVALGERGVPASKAREDGSDAGWRVGVAPADASRAHRILSERGLPRSRPPGFGEVFAKGSMVPTPTEEHALYLHALGGELARSIEAIDGVVEARVHLGLRQHDPLRPVGAAAAAPRGAVLVKCRPAGCDAVRALEPGIRSIVAGAVDGLEVSSVSVVVADASESTPPPTAARRRGSALLVGLAAGAAIAALALASPALWARLRREVSS
jgi:type III secretion protein J